MNPARDYYKILQIDPEADPEVVTAAFRALARRLHPDRDITGVEEYRMAELNRAYTVLRDPERRRQYDAERRLRTPVGPGMEEAPRQGGLAARWKANRDATVNGNGQASASGDAESQETRLNFGRYAGQTLRQIAAQDGDYLRWLARHSSGLRFRAEIERILREPTDAGYSSRPSR